MKVVQKILELLTRLHIKFHLGEGCCAVCFASSLANGEIDGLVAFLALPGITYRFVSLSDNFSKDVVFSTPCYAINACT